MKRGVLGEKNPNCLWNGFPPIARSSNCAHFLSSSQQLEAPAGRGKESIHPVSAS